MANTSVIGNFVFSNNRRIKFPGTICKGEFLRYGKKFTKLANSRKCHKLRMTDCSHLALTTDSFKRTSFIILQLQNFEGVTLAEVCSISCLLPLNLFIIFQLRSRAWIWCHYPNTRYKRQKLMLTSQKKEKKKILKQQFFFSNFDAQFWIIPFKNFPKNN